MRNRPRIVILLCMLFSAVFSQAENIEYSNSKISKYPYVNYLGKSERYYFYKTGSDQVSRFSIGNPKEFKDIKLSAPATKSYLNVYWYNAHFYTVSLETETDEKTKLKKNVLTLSKLQAETGSLIKHIQFERTDSSKIYFGHQLDTITARFYIKKAGEVVGSYDADLEETEDFTPAVTRSKPILMSNLSEAIAELLKSLGGNIRITLNGLESSEKYTAHKDSSSMAFYNIIYERKKDEDIYAFKSRVIELRVESKDGKAKAEIELDADMHIIDINYREDAAGRLVFFGKYTIKGNVKSRYGMFSVVFNRDLSVAAKLRYNELATIENFEGTVPNEKYIGFIFDKLHGMDYEFFLKEEGVFLFTYQHVYTNLQDHIYVLKVESNGEITVNRIVNRLNQKTKSGHNEKHLALLSGKELYFLFYDHVANAGMKVNETNYLTGDIDKKTCVLMSCTYNIAEDDFSKKSIIADKKTLVQLPHLYAPVVFYDVNTDKNICLLRGFDKKRNTVSLFEFYFRREI